MSVCYRQGGSESGVAVKRGSTVVLISQISHVINCISAGQSCCQSFAVGQSCCQLLELISHTANHDYVLLAVADYILVPISRATSYFAILSQSQLYMLLASHNGDYQCQLVMLPICPAGCCHQLSCCGHRGIGKLNQHSLCICAIPYCTYS